jgi:transposase
MNAGTHAVIEKSKKLSAQILETWQRTPDLASVASIIGCTKKTIRLAVRRAGRSAELEGQQRAERAKKILKLWKNGKGQSTLQIANILKCHTTTVERIIHKADLGETLTGQVKVKRKKRKVKPKKSLGQAKSWAKTLQIIKGLMEGISHTNLKKSFNTTRETISKTCARAKKAGFALESEVTITRDENNTFYLAAFMLYERKAVRKIAKALNAKENKLRELRKLVKEILLS